MMSFSNMFYLYMTFLVCNLFAYIDVSLNIKNSNLSLQKIETSVGEVVMISNQEIWIECRDIPTYKYSIKMTKDGGRSWKTVLSLDEALIFGFNVIGDRVWVYGVYAKTKAPLLLKSVNQGKDWITVDTKTNGILERGAFYSADTGWIFTQYGNLLPIYNAMPTPIVPVTRVRKKVEIMGVQSAQNVWFATAEGAFFQSKDSGQTWLERTDIFMVINKFQSSGIIQPVSIKFINNNYGFIAAKIVVNAKHYKDRHDIGIILSTKDGGKNWRLRKVTGAEGMGVLSVVSTNEFWVLPTTSAISEVLLHSLDGGISWSKVKLPEKFQHVTNIIFQDTKNGIIIDSTGTWSNELFITQDSGKNWGKIIYY